MCLAFGFIASFQIHSVSNGFADAVYHFQNFMFLGDKCRSKFNDVAVAVAGSANNQIMIIEGERSGISS